jgi:DNA-directed RNA polymerase subunit N (RpoN/RPB10)
LMIAEHFLLTLRILGQDSSTAADGLGLRRACSRR